MCLSIISDNAQNGHALTGSPGVPFLPSVPLSPFIPGSPSPPGSPGSPLRPDSPYGDKTNKGMHSARINL